MVYFLFSLSPLSLPVIICGSGNKENVDWYDKLISGKEGALCCKCQHNTNQMLEVHCYTIVWVAVINDDTVSTEIYGPELSHF